MRRHIEILAQYIDENVQFPAKGPMNEFITPS
jgi:hypothetical protein